ncbi:RDD domain containing protein [Thioalkalivibrio nitratireducens DSM 14787]|uniref:RDD domain containing protein n=1 Tax=Thioalkalivibrio nitratireducens (strain DSM 14787 / UNIQEM 213 / ALEN2) TaxID=1255043 RepID=L0DSM0_THIND|nr:RDD family protein [Thioalkalivibrio nitratireducens]AGA31992.1 RDD domain containing protein [Thioalkalivibrio nitratireducens DSM 14787]
MPAGERWEDPGRVHPWIRLWARAFDVLLVAVPLGLAQWHWFRPAEPGWFDLMLFGMLALFVWLLLEPILISRLATSPGKWVFSIRILNRDGSRLSYSQALRRSDMVWAKGLGAGTPLIGQFLMAAQHYQLSRDATTFWDDEGGFDVRHGEIRAPRVIAAAAIVAFAVIALAAGAY